MLELNFFGEGARFHHVGLVVRSIMNTIDQPVAICEDERQKVKVAFLALDGALIELVEPLDSDSPVMQNLNANHKLLHLCYEVPHLEAATEAARIRGFHCIAHPAPAEALDRRRITWLFHPDYGLVELLESTPLSQ